MTERRKRKILFISPDTAPYDDQMALFWLLKGLDPERYEAIVAFHKECSLMRQVESLGHRVIRFPRIRLAKKERPHLRGLGERLTWWLWKKTRGEKVVKLIEDEQVDLVHTASLIRFEGAYAAMKTQRPHVWHIRDILPGNRRLFGVFGTRKTLKVISRYSHRVVCVSDAAKWQFSGWQRQPEKYVTLYDGVEPRIWEVAESSALPADKMSLRGQFGILEKDPVIAFWGAATPAKAFSDLVDACVLLHQDGVSFQLVLIGAFAEDHFQEQMLDAVADAGFRSQFHILDDVPAQDWPWLLKQADILAIPGANEAFPSGALEAMALGLPVVGANVGSTTEVVQHNRTGLLVKPGMPGALAQALKTLISDPEYRRVLGQAGQSRAKAQFSMTNYWEQFDALYTQCLP